MVIFFSSNGILGRKKQLPGGVKKILMLNSAQVSHTACHFEKKVRTVIYLKPIFFGPKVFYTCR